ncbi:hypothetical protein KW455_17680 [Vibrio fluvialis]|nr:hypothetical protein [Vibrio fluvialis]
MSEWVDLYCKFGFYYSIVSLFLFPFFNFGGRLTGFYGEPAGYVQGMAPVLFICFYRWKVNGLGEYRNKFFVTLIPYLLTVSSVGLIGLLTIFIVVYGIRKMVYGLITVIVFFIVAMNLSPMVKERVEDSVFIISNLGNKNAIESYYAVRPNFSVYALQSNMYVAYRSLLDNPFSGVGLGNHSIAHERYISSAPGYTAISKYNLENLNSDDANSLLLRVTSELGFIGIIMVFFLFFRVPMDTKGKIIKGMFLVIMSIKLVRSGNYFTPEFIPALVLYLKYTKNYKWS